MEMKFVTCQFTVYPFADWLSQTGPVHTKIVRAAFGSQALMVAYGICGLIGTLSRFFRIKLMIRSRWPILP
ncbi:hypothetical protein XGA_2061 [Xanthomonas hortorum ATCC 19865]|nr:hypothetical protein XGA_2061 [Xanthomonas hortorum ATCC 19865]